MTVSSHTHPCRIPVTAHGRRVDDNPPRPTCTPTSYPDDYHARVPCHIPAFVCTQGVADGSSRSFNIAFQHSFPLISQCPIPAATSSHTSVLRVPTTAHTLEWLIGRSWLNWVFTIDHHNVPPIWSWSICCPSAAICWNLLRRRRSMSEVLCVRCIFLPTTFHHHIAAATEYHLNAFPWKFYAWQWLSDYDTSDLEVHFSSFSVMWSPLARQHGLTMTRAGELKWTSDPSSSSRLLDVFLIMGFTHHNQNFNDL